MKAKLVTLDMKHMPRNKQSRASQKIYGYTDKSNNSTHVYQREGILSNVPHLKIAKGAFIMREKDDSKIQEIEALGAKCTIYDISIKKWF